LARNNSVDAVEDEMASIVWRVDGRKRREVK
jgi:hypothetical protein